MGTMIEVAASDGSGKFNVYKAVPDGTPKGAIVVIQEIFGINPGIRSKCDEWAAAGYSAYALDLFWRFAPGVELDPDIPEQMQQALGLMGSFDRDKGVEDIQATINVARTQTGTKVGVIGFCLGGFLAYLSATRTDADASIGYYGVMINNFLNESSSITKPLMLHFAEKDGFVPPEQLAVVRDGLASNPLVEIYEYPGVDHGFAAQFGERRVEDAAVLADGRTRAFIASHVG